MPAPALFKQVAVLIQTKPSQIIMLITSTPIDPDASTERAKNIGHHHQDFIHLGSF